MGDPVRSVERALDVLLCFSEENRELSMTQIAEMVGMNKSTIHRLLLTLEKKQFVQREAVSGVYRPGLRLLQLAYLTKDHHDLEEVASPYLHRLSNEYRETVDLAILDGDSVVFTDVVESPQRVKLAAAIGQRLPAFCTASGKAILAFLPEEKTMHILSHTLRKYTSFTPVDTEAIMADLLGTKSRGFAYSEEEYEDGINAVSAPILDPRGMPIAAIAVAGPTFRLPKDRMLEVGPSILEATRQISRERWKYSG